MDKPETTPAQSYLLRAMARIEAMDQEAVQIAASGKNVLEAHQTVDALSAANLSTSAWRGAKL